MLRVSTRAILPGLMAGKRISTTLPPLVIALDRSRSGCFMDDLKLLRAVRKDAQIVSQCDRGIVYGLGVLFHVVRDFGCICACRCEVNHILSHLGDYRGDEIDDSRSFLYACFGLASKDVFGVGYEAWNHRNDLCDKSLDDLPHICLPCELGGDWACYQSPRG